MTATNISTVSSVQLDNAPNEGFSEKNVKFKCTDGVTYVISFDTLKHLIVEVDELMENIH